MNFATFEREKMSSLDSLILNTYTYTCAFLYHLAINLGLYNILILWQPSFQTADGSIEKGRSDDRPLPMVACYRLSYIALPLGYNALHQFREIGGVFWG